MNPLGVNAWVWTSPVTTAELERLAPHGAAMGFDWLEIPLESLDDLNHSLTSKVQSMRATAIWHMIGFKFLRKLIHSN